MVAVVRSEAPAAAQDWTPRLESVRNLAVSGDWSAAGAACRDLYREALECDAFQAASVAARIHSNCSFNLNDFNEAQAWAERSLVTARQAESQAELVGAWVLLAGSRAALGDARGAAEAIVQTTTLLDDRLPAVIRLGVYNWLAIAYESLGLHELRLRILRQRLEVSVLLNHDTAPTARVEMLLAIVDVCDTLRPVDAGAADRLLDEARSLLPVVEHETLRSAAWIRSMAQAARGAVLARLGELDTAVDLLRGVVDRGDDEIVGFTRVLCSLELARALAARGDAQSAGGVAEAAAQRVRSQSRADRVDLLEMQTLAELDRLRGRDSESVDLRARCVSLFHRNVMALFDAQVEGLTRRVAEQTLLLQNVSLRELTVDLRRQAGTDALTGLLNRRSLERVYSALQAQAMPPALVMIDIDHFKRVNDQHSHSTGDEVLRRVALTLAQELRDTDRVGRYGGEEFVVLLAQVGPNDAASLAERLRQRVEALDWPALAPGLAVTLSAGLVQTRLAEPFESAVRRADTLLYRAKAQGRNRIIAEQEGP